MSTMFYDIETIPLPLSEREHLRPEPWEIKTGNLKDPAKLKAKRAEALKAWDSGETSALDAMLGRVALIGFCIDDGDFQFIADDDETAMLDQWWRLVAGEGRGCCVAHNKSFDLGFLIRRSWLNGITVPHRYIEDAMSYRSNQWQDTMRLWSLGDRQAPYVSLEKMGKAFGLEVKESKVTGKDFYKHWEKDKEACIEYNRQDVECCRDVWHAMGGV